MKANESRSTADTCATCVHFDSSALEGYGYCRSAPTALLRARFFSWTSRACRSFSVLKRTLDHERLIFTRPSNRTLFLCLRLLRTLRTVLIFGRKGWGRF